MIDQTARTHIWLAELAAIKAEIEANGMPVPPPSRKRSRKLKPLWEE